VERLHRAIGAADERVAALGGVREAVAAEVARLRERKSVGGGVSRGECDREVREVSESLRRKVEELDRLREGFVPSRSPQAHAPPSRTEFCGRWRSNARPHG
jgi:hypothetical protein